MGVTLRSFILAFILILAAAVLYQLSKGPETVDDPTLLERYPSFSATNFSGDNFDANGRLLHHINAQTVTYYQSKGLLLMTKPRGIYYNYNTDKADPEPWQLSADSGRLVMDDEAELKGHVVLTPRFAGSALTLAETSYLHFDLKKNFISTPKQIRILGPNFVNYGQGLRADMNTKQVYIDDPRARYEFN